MTWARFKKIALGWHIYVLPVLYILWVGTQRPSRTISLADLDRVLPEQLGKCLVNHAALAQIFQHGQHRHRPSLYRPADQSLCHANSRSVGDVRRRLIPKGALRLCLAGVYIITAWFFGWTSDSLLRGRRWVWPAFTTILNASVCLALANLPLYKHIKAHFVLYCAHSSEPSRCSSTADVSITQILRKSQAA